MDELKVTTPYGVLRGTRTSRGGEAYLGIPYAKPPVDGLRWKPPVEPDASDAEIDCTKLGYSAMQKFDPVMAASKREQSEDCLTLNVWVKDSSKKNLPVMVYLHGGAYVEGGSSDPLYDGTNFTDRHDVIIVTVNYRVNLFGFMNFATVPGGEDYQESGYLGTMDQVAALKWVQKCIENFGGDPSNVTLFGESAGSGSAGLLMVTPAAKGLFQKVICESGPIQIYNAPENTAPYAEDFMRMMGCSNMAEMCEKSTEEIMDVFNNQFFDKYIQDISLIFGPTCDGNYIPRKPMKAFKDGVASGIKLLIGTNADEFNYWGLYFDDIVKDMPVWWRHQAVFHFDGKLDSDKYEELFANAHADVDPAQRYMDYTNKIGFIIGSELMSEYQSGHDDAYFYMFTYASKVPGMGSCHAIELPFVMHNTHLEDLAQNLTGEVPPLHLADEMNDAWAAFAATGKPVGPDGLEWPTYGEGRACMVMGENEWHVELDRNATDRELLRPAFDECLLSE